MTGAPPIKMPPYFAEESADYNWPHTRETSFQEESTDHHENPSLRIPINYLEMHGQLEYNVPVLSIFSVSAEVYCFGN